MFERVMMLIERGAVPGGTVRNLEAASEYTDWGTVSDGGKTLAADAQTSGGLLLAVAPDAADTFDEMLQDEGVEVRARIGTIREAGDRLIRFT